MSGARATMFADWDEKTTTGIDWVPGAVRSLEVARRDWSLFEEWLLARQETKKLWYRTNKGERAFVASVITLGRVS